MRFAVVAAILACIPAAFARAGEPPINVGQRREIFADGYLIEAMHGVRLNLCEPRDEGRVVAFDKPWEGPFCGYCTVLQDGGKYLLYYRGKPTSKADGAGEVTCLAESTDGIHWTKPNLGLFEFDGHRENNIVLATDGLSHNFSPLVDANPAVPAEERFKALAGTIKTGLVALVSADGRQWRKLQDDPVLAKADVPFPYMFDSQNVAFYSTAERKYLTYFRVFQDQVRRICRAESDDFVHWRNIQLMEYRRPDGSAAPIEHLYTNQTHPYFRAPHLYIAVCARFMPGRQVLSAAEAQAIHVNPNYFKDASDAIFMTTRGGNVYDRALLGAFIRPGIGAQNWVSRTNYPALNVVQTGPTEMSVYVNQDYAQPTAHLRRYSLRLDGFASLRAPHESGEAALKPLTFSGKTLLINFATSAAGGIRVELQDAAGQPIPGFALDDSVEAIGNEIERAVRWKQGDDLSSLRGQVVRLRFVMKDADLYALQFAE